ncbi:MAG: DUF423 domain-containing protein [Ignavibacteriaceae bacterium]|nr:DUF423 domain-containing protein [Ignavibacteriaceae bacterium]
MNMNKKYLIIAGISGFLAVALGAFGSHGLENKLTPEMLSIYKTGVLYHLIHSVLLAALALTGADKFKNTFYFIAAGIVLFSFSLYIYSITEVRWLAFITPFGGVAFLTGWVMLIVEGIKRKNSL